MTKQQRLVIAHGISLLTNPVVLVVAATAFITYRYADDVSEFLRWQSIATGLLILPALIYTATMWLREHQIDIDVTKREDRVIPLLLSALGALVGSYLVSNQPVEIPNLAVMSNILVGLLIALTIITTIWKISLHATTLTALATLMVLFGGSQFIWLYLLLIPVGWARQVLRQHSLWQLVAGALLGAGATIGIYTFFAK